MRNADDLAAEFTLAKKHGAAGIIVWGSSSDVRNAADCAEVTEFVNTTLGPLLQSL
jgi:hypothetical protein